jgi:mono/diheme cytochrome c family protein
MKPLKILMGCCLALALAAGIFALFGRPSAIAPISPPDRAHFDPVQVKRGAELAAIGNCDVCHTAPGSVVFAGGRAVPTPFGTIYSTNITPDPATGIGRWSEAAFRRAMRDGVRRDGAHLYPAFPYDHFTLVSDDDDEALYAFLMTREPAYAPAPANALPFPLNVRLVMAGWNLLFLRRGPFRADPAQSQAWNRGAYLVEGLGHCGACHTPRNVFGAEENDKLAGGAVDGWTAYALNAASPAPVPWTADALFAYLRRGAQQWHGVARGPMVPVVDDLHAVPDDDVRAMAIYIATGTASPNGETGAQTVKVTAHRDSAADVISADSQVDTAAPGAAAQAVNSADPGAMIYAGACANCHEGPRPVPYGGLDLRLSSGVNGPDPNNLINVVLYGLPAADGARSPNMPGFAGSMSDSQLVALVRYLRARFSANGPWQDVAHHVAEARSASRAMSVSHAPIDPAMSLPSNPRAP